MRVLFTNLNNLLAPHIQSQFGLDLCVSGCVALILCMIVVVIGVIVNFFENLIYKLLFRLVGQKFAMTICNYLTFPGVILHEIAHAIMIFITGGKITHIKLFEICANGRLGHVDFCTRGRLRNQFIQLCCGSCAPVVFGLVEVYLLIVKFLPATAGTMWYYFVWYMIISISFHMSMSREDLRLYFKGLLYVFPAVWVSMMVLQFFVFR